MHVNIIFPEKYIVFLLYFQDRSKLRLYSLGGLQNAFQAVKDNEMSVHRASVVYNISLTTLRDSVDGRINIDTIKSGRRGEISQSHQGNG